MWAGLVGTVSGKLLWTFGSCLVLYPGRKKTTRRMGDRFFFVSLTQAGKGNTLVAPTALLLHYRSKHVVFRVTRSLKRKETQTRL
jgi:hypothetical protein